MKVRFRSKKEIEGQAVALLRDYFAGADGQITLPIPVEEILEVHLGLSLSLCDLRTTFGVSNALAAICIEGREIVVDEHLDPSHNRILEGRYRFTLAHEIGHWVLHQNLSKKGASVSWLVTRGLNSAPEERQANEFAAALLMPEEEVRSLWLKATKSLEPMVYEDYRGRSITRRPPSRRFNALGAVAARAAEPEHAYFFEQAAKDFTPIFRVSNEAMRIRLEDLGLLRVWH